MSDSRTQIRRDSEPVSGSGIGGTLVQTPAKQLHFTNRRAHFDEFESPGQDRSRISPFPGLRNQISQDSRLPDPESSGILGTSPRFRRQRNGYISPSFRRISMNSSLPGQIAARSRRFQARLQPDLAVSRPPDPDFPGFAASGPRIPLEFSRKSQKY